MIENLLVNYEEAFAVILFGIGFTMLLFQQNLFKKLIGLNIMDTGTFLFLASMGYASILWSIDTLDWKTRNASSTVSSVLNNVKDGDIILMHSLYGATAEAVETMVPELVRRGYQLVTVSELAAARGGMKAGTNIGSFRK